MYQKGESAMPLRGNVTASLPQEMYADLEAASQLLQMSMGTIARILLQLHLENDPALLDPVLFRKVYRVPHDYHPLSPEEKQYGRRAQPAI